MLPTALDHRLSRLAFLPERVLRFIDPDPDSSHLLWTASTTQLGYPRVSRHGKLVMLARWIAEEVHGPAPTPRHQAGHRCHDEQIDVCPVGLPELDFHRLCCNPDHIVWQTARQNSLASARTVAHRNAAKLTCAHGHMLGASTDKTGRRTCWECPPSITRLVRHDPEINALYAAI